jgi:serine/threonine-protein kinase
MIRAGVLAHEDEVERFCREAQAVLRLSHPHIVQVYDFGHADGRPYFTMQLAPGGSLAKHRARFTADPRAAVALLEKVARAVEHAHRHGILHRDLKPANVLLGESDEPLVADFGLAKFLHADTEGLTQTGVTPGTPSYMAPEQAAGRRHEVGPPTDVWALGVILYELLAGQRPIDGANREEILHKILTTEPPRPRDARPDLDPALEAVVLRCLEKEPAKRYASAGALADDLGRWLRGEQSTQPRLQRPALLRQRIRRHPFRTAAAVLCLGVVLALGAGLLWRRLQPAAPPAGDDGQSIVLIGDNHFPPALNWIGGGQGAVADPTADGLSISSPKTSLLELLPATVWERYRLEAEVRHDSTREGEVGLYFSQGWVPTDQGPTPILCAASFAEEGLCAGQLFFKISWLAQTPQCFGTHGYRTHHFQPSPGAGGLPPWHTLAAEVTPERVRLYWDNQGVAEISVNDFQGPGITLFDDLPAANTWRFNPQGGLGVFIDGGGTATFRHVVLKPLPKAP